MAFQGSDLLIISRSGTHYNVAGSDVLAYIQGEVGTSEYEVADIAARNALSGLSVGDRVFVTDASTDATVSSGWAIYVWRGAAFTKVAEEEMLDITVSGADLTWTTTATNAQIASSSGTNATLTAATDTDAGLMTAADHAKLDGIEASADVTDTANVTAAGALMDSEVTNLAAVKAFAPADYATAAQGTLAASATQPGDLATVATSGDYGDLINKPTITGTDLSWSSGATNGFLASSTGANATILAATTTDAGLMTTVQFDKLAGIEAGANVTDTANVTAAGALMDSEVTNLAAVKAFDPADYAAASHTHSAAAVTSGTFASARISQASVTQHEAALTITQSQISDLGDEVDLAGTVNTNPLTISGQTLGFSISQLSSAP